MAEKKITWTFPPRKYYFMKIESYSVSVIALIILLFSYLQLQSFLFALLFTILFFGIYTLISMLIQTIHHIEESYHLTSTHLEITRKTSRKIKKEKIPLKKIKKHKLDHFFMGGYVVTKDKRYPLYFNSKQEVKKFEVFLKKHLK